jgi:CubicO group peptidase (beta-lactamase class C family)
MHLFVGVLLSFFSAPALAQLQRAESHLLRATAARTLPGGVLMVGSKDGSQHLSLSVGTVSGKHTPQPEATLYDLASLTKVVVTATSIMLLEEQGLLSLKSRIQDFYPDFNRGISSPASIEDLLRHKAGLPAGIPVGGSEDYSSYLARLVSAPLSYAPGSKTVYSDVGFIILGDLVTKLSGMSLGDFAQLHIFRPLQMRSSYFDVPRADQPRCAPTGPGPLCRPHDPKARRLYPSQLGHAGLFSTAQDLWRFVLMLQNGGAWKGVRVLQESSVRKMVELAPGELRGLGWDLLSPLAAAPRGEVFPAGISFGHTGYTGTTIWIDPQSGGHMIFLSNRVLLGDTQTARPFIQLRRDLANAVGQYFYPETGLDFRGEIDFNVLINFIPQD